jgi:RNA polymerase sigma-70 factor (ECF subfamily)
MEGVMIAEAPATRPSLLVRLRNSADQQAWEQFVDLYAPTIYGYARKHRLQDADAADLTQDVLRRVANRMGGFSYDPRCGSFRGWLFTVVRNRLHDFLAQRNGRCQASGDPAVQQLLDRHAAPSDEESAEWQREYRRSLFTWASDRVRPLVQETTWQAFWQTAIEGKKPQDVADSLSLSLAAVYLAKSRVIARLRAVIREHEQLERE